MDMIMVPIRFVRLDRLHVAAPRPAAGTPREAAFSESLRKLVPERDPLGVYHTSLALDPRGVYHAGTSLALEREQREEGPSGAAMPEIDPSVRQAAQLGPPPTAAPVASAQGLHARSSLEDILPAMVRRIAWSRDGRRGSVRLEIGAGELAGGTLLVHAEDGRVNVRLSAPAGVDGERWRERISERLRARGLSVEAVEVD
jgi:hypothetical protein